MEKESFLDIKDMLKPVVKDKVQPQKANTSTSNLTKVKLCAVFLRVFLRLREHAHSTNECS